MRSHAVSTRDMRSRKAGDVVMEEAAAAGIGPRCWLRSAPSIATCHDDANEGDPMADLKKQFEQAVADSKSLPEKPDNMTLLKMYALYKQASSGDADGKRPGFGDMVGRAKWDAWNELKGKSGDEAMQEYVDLIESLKE
jgi:acyl-CoA-binding protein